MCSLLTGVDGGLMVMTDRLDEALRVAVAAYGEDVVCEAVLASALFRDLRPNSAAAIRHAVNAIEAGADGNLFFRWVGVAAADVTFVTDSVMISLVSEPRRSLDDGPAD